MNHRHLSRLQPCSLGLGLRLGLSGGGLFNPMILFANNEQGVWFDPSDLSTIFQDSAGTTAGAVGSPVGLHLDKSKGLALGVSQIANGAVGLTGSATAASYNTGTGEGSVTRVDSSNQSFVQWASLLAYGWYQISIANTGASQLTLRTGSANGTVGYTLAAGQSVTALVSASVSGAITIAAETGTTATFTVTSFKHIAGNHRYQTTSASRPLLQETSGLRHLTYDGTDDYLVTNAIDFSASDKITVFAGVRKLSDAAAGMLMELSANVNSNAGSFYITAPESTTVEYGTTSRGDAAANTNQLASYDNAAVAAPVTSVLTATHDIAGDSSVLRVNGVTVASSSGNKGAGNFGSYAVYFGRRGGASVPFNGRDYGTIIRLGAITDALRNQAEAWLNGKTGAY